MNAGRTGISWVDQELERIHAAEEAARAHWQAKLDELTLTNLPKPRPPKVEKRTDRARRKQALIIGINYEWSKNALGGCVLDANRWAKRYREHGWEVVLLLGRDATKARVMQELSIAHAWAETGDHLAFIDSSHGSTLPDYRDPTGQVEVVCLADCMDDDSAEGFVAGCLSSVEMATELHALPAGVLYHFTLDCCHSQIPRESLQHLLARALPNGREPLQIARYLPAPEILQRAIVAAQISAKKRFAHRSRELVQIQGLEPIIFTGCKTEQTSADALINNERCGAFSTYLLQSYNNTPYDPAKIIIDRTVKNLRRDGYEQEPTIEGSPERTSHRFPIAVDSVA